MIQCHLDIDIFNLNKIGLNCEKSNTPYTMSTSGFHSHFQAPTYQFLVLILIIAVPIMLIAFSVPYV